MQVLDELWATDEGMLPFSCTVSEHLIYDALVNIASDDRINNTVCKKTRQWIQFNRFINEHEEEPYQTWVEQIYSQIEAVLRSKFENDFRDFTSSYVAQEDQRHDEESTGETWRE